MCKNTLQIAYSSESPQCMSSVMLLYEHRQQWQITNKHIRSNVQTDNLGGLRIYLAYSIKQNMRWIWMIFGMGCVYNDKEDSLQDVMLHKNVRQ